MLISWQVSGQPKWPYVTRPPLRADALGIQTPAERLGTSLASKPSSFLSTLLRSLKFSAAHIALNVIITIIYFTVPTMWPPLENSIAGCHANVDTLSYHLEEYINANICMMKVLQTLFCFHFFLLCSFQISVCRLTSFDLCIIWPLRFSHRITGMSLISACEILDHLSRSAGTGAQTAHCLTLITASTHSPL